MRLNYIPNAILVSLILKTLILGCTIPDALAISALAAMVAFYHYLDDKKEVPANAKIIADIALMKSELEMTKSSVNAMKFGAALKLK